MYIYLMSARLHSFLTRCRGGGWQQPSEPRPTQLDPRRGGRRQRGRGDRGREVGPSGQTDQPRHPGKQPNPCCTTRSTTKKNSISNRDSTGAAF